MILSFILSFITGCIPSIFKIYQDYLDKKHELQMRQLDLQVNQMVMEEKYQEAAMSFNMEDMKTKYQTYNIGNKWVDAINGLVRPTFAYSILLNYLGITLACCIQTCGELSGVDFIDAIWGEADNQILGAVLGFYFSGRANERLFN